MAQASYYSGDLAAINEGRSRDAAIQAEDARSFRNLVAMMAAERNRAQLGNRELGIREALGGRQLDMTGRELDIRDRLGTEELGLRRTLGTGELENQRNRIGAERLGALLRYDVGLRGIQQADTATALNYDAQLKQIEQQAAAVKANLDAMKSYYQAGGGVDTRMAIEIARQEREMDMLRADAEEVARRATSAAAQSAIGSKHKVPGATSRWYDFVQSEAEERDAYLSKPEFGDAVRSQYLDTLPVEQASQIEWDPASLRFIPRRSMFNRRPQSGSAPMPQTPVATPGINPASERPKITLGEYLKYQQRQQ